MKTELKAKYLQNLLKKKKNQNAGFTLIELLVVIIIIGILAAIALPSFLNQAGKAKQSEAKTYAGSVNRAQQAYRLENATFASDLATLNVIPGATSGTATTTDNYTYTIPSGVTALAADVTAIPIDTALKAYRGCVKAAAGTAGSFDSDVEESTSNAAPGACTY